LFFRKIGEKRRAAAGSTSSVDCKQLQRGQALSRRESHEANWLTYRRIASWLFSISSWGVLSRQTKHEPSRSVPQPVSRFLAWDALSSAAYGPEAALTLLIPLGAAGIAYIAPISASIIVLLTIVYFSYRQTIQAYPGGGGSYTVARQNLGVSAGLLAAAALMIDYVLVVAVGISADVGALVSAVPSLQPRTLLLCLASS
jgi:hypothetical protein